MWLCVNPQNTDFWWGKEWTSITKNTFFPFKIVPFPFNKNSCYIDAHIMMILSLITSVSKWPETTSFGKRCHTLLFPFLSFHCHCYSKPFAWLAHWIWTDASKHIHTDSQVNNSNILLFSRNYIVQEVKLFSQHSINNQLCKTCWIWSRSKTFKSTSMLSIICFSVLYINLVKNL